MTSPGGNRMTSSQICRFQSYSDSIGLKITTVCIRFFFFHLNNALLVLNFMINLSDFFNVMLEI